MNEVDNILQEMLDDLEKMEKEMNYGYYEPEQLDLLNRRLVRELGKVQKAKAKFDKVKFLPILPLFLTIGSIILCSVLSTFGLGSLAGGAGGLIALFGIITAVSILTVFWDAGWEIDATNKRFAQKSKFNLYEDVEDYINDQLDEINAMIIQKSREASKEDKTK